MVDNSQSDERKAILLSVGTALDQWSYVEQFLENTFAILLGVAEGPAHVAFSSIRSLHARLLVLNNLVESMGLGPEITPRWRSLYNRVSRKNEKRNEIAHFKILATRNKQGVESPKLFPYHSTGSALLAGSKSPLTPPSPGLSRKEIEERAVSISKLASEIFQFNGDLRQHLARRQESLGLDRYPAPEPSIPNDPIPTEPTDPHRS